MNSTSKEEEETVRRKGSSNQKEWYDGEEIEDMFHDSISSPLPLGKLPLPPPEGERNENNGK